jgi:hypothetical protein
MIYKTDLIEYLQGILNDVPRTINIVSVSNPSVGVYSMMVDDIKWLQPSSIIWIGGVDYTITLVNGCEVVVTGGTAITAETFNAPEIHFFHGTVKETDITLRNIQNAMDKTPFLYLMESFTERFNLDFESSIDRTVDLRIFFATHSNYPEWVIDDIYNNALRPMQRLAQTFVDTLNKDVRIEEVLEFQITNLSRFGVYVNNKGFDASLFQDILTGVELSMTFEMVKIYPCDNGC